MLTRNILFLLTITTLFSTVHAANEDLRFEHLTLEQSQAQSRVQAILQDRTGFMWFGTDDGLNRYDGYSFVVYRHDPENPGSLSDNTVWSLCEDSSGVLWIGTSSGLSKFLRETDEFINYDLEHVESRRGRKNPARIIFFDSFGKLWLGSSGGLVQHIPETDEFIYYRHDPGDEHSLSHNTVFTIFEDRSGHLWVGTHNGLNRFERQTGNFVRYYISAERPGITSIAEGRGGNLWIGTTGGLSQFDREEGKFMVDTPEFLKATASEERVIFTIQEDRRGRIWFGGGWGLARLDPSDDLTVFNNDPKDQFSLSDDFVISIYEDRSGVLWIGTRNGINRLDHRKNKFKNYTFGLKDSKSTSNNVRAIYQDGSGTLWLGTSKGLVKYDRISGKVTHYNHDPNDSKSLGNDQILTIAADSAGVLWVGTVEGLNEFDRKKGVFKRHQIQTGASNIMGGNFVYTIHRDRAGSLWIGTLAGLGLFDPATSSFTELYQNQPENPPHSLSNNSVLFIYEDRFGILWIGTNDGLNRIDRKKSTITHFKSEPGNPNSLSNNKVYSIYEDRMGGIWVGTAAGLNRFDRAEERFTRYTQKDGLASGKIHSILEDANGNLWLSTNSGLTRFRVEGGFKDETPPRLQIRNYDESDGLGRNQLNINASWYGENGEMFFGGMNGLTAFHPDSVTSDQGVPPIVLTSFKKFNEPVKLDTAIYAIKELALTHRDYAFSFEFAALDLTAPQKNRFAYKLEGLDKNWIDLGTKHDITFTNLDAGEYIFRVKGSNNAGVWNEEGASVKIIITPPYWQTWWFRSLSLFTVIALLFTAFKVRTRSIQAHNVRLLNEIDERGKAESALRKSETQYRTLFEQATDAIFIADPNGNYIDVSPSACEMVGYSRDELLGLSIDALIPREDLQSDPIQYDDLMAGKEVFRERRLRRKDKRILTGEVSAKMLDDGRIQIFVRDITKRKQAEEALIKNEQLLSSIINNASAVIYVKAVDGRYLLINKQYETLFNVTFEEIEGKTDHDIFPKGNADVFRANDLQVIEARSVIECEEVAPHPDGPYTYISIKFPLFDSTGNIYATCGISTDITERTLAEMALRKSEAALAEAQRITHVGSWSIDVATGKITWSDEMYRIHGITKEAFDGNFATTLNWIHPDDRERILALHKKLYTEHIPTTDEYRITLPDGSIQTLFGRGEVEFDKDGKPVRYYGIVQDITERKYAEQALQQSQQQLRALADHLQSVREEERTAIAREMHDELGQVLTALKMDLTMMETELQSKQSDPSTQLSEIKRMKGVIDNTIVKVRTLIQELRPEVLDNLGLIAALEWQAEEFNSRTDIDYKFNSKVKDINVPKETATAVFRIFQETLTNIARHSEATHFEVNISKKNGHLFLKIADNGVGIPPDKIENSKTFGLLGMKERALILGGQVEIRGSKGKGTTVTIRIPIWG